MPKQVRFLKNYDSYASGEIASFDDDLAAVYIKNEIAEEVGAKNTEEVEQKDSSSDNPKGTNKDSNKETNKQ